MNNKEIPIYNLTDDLQYQKLKGYIAVKCSHLTILLIFVAIIGLVNFAIFICDLKKHQSYKELEAASKEISMEYDILKINLNDCEQSKISVYEDHKLISNEKNN